MTIQTAFRQKTDILTVAVNCQTPDFKAFPPRNVACRAAPNVHMLFTFAKTRERADREKIAPLARIYPIAFLFRRGSACVFGTLAKTTTNGI